MLCGMWDLPGPGLEPVTPALAGGFLTTAPPGKPLHYCFLTAPPLFMHSLISLVSNCLSLPFGIQGRSRRRNEAYFLQTRNRGHRKGLYREGRTGSCSVSLLASTSVFTLFTFQISVLSVPLTVKQPMLTLKCILTLYLFMLMIRLNGLL